MKKKKPPHDGGGRDVPAISTDALVEALSQLTLRVNGVLGAVADIFEATPLWVKETPNWSAALERYESALEFLLSYSPPRPGEEGNGHDDDEEDGSP